MKVIIALLLCVLMSVSCKKEAPVNKSVTPNNKTKTYKVFGKSIQPHDAISAASMATHFSTMQIGDTIPAKFSAQVRRVCKVKGCWMTLVLPNRMEVMVNFKDYAFFVPESSIGKEVIMNGWAYIKINSVASQQHYAKDVGQSEKEIKAIITPKRSYMFKADGVLIPE